MVAQAVKEYAANRAAALAAIRPYRERAVLAPAPVIQYTPDYSLHEFLRLCWGILNDGIPFRDGWHIRALCEHLEAVTAGEIQNIIFTMPPRTTKSTTVSVVWPAWEWHHRPREQFLGISSTINLAERDALASRRLIESAWYQTQWGDRFRLMGDQNAKRYYQNSRGGHRSAFGMDSKVTGQNATRIIVDDPHAVQEAESETKRQDVLDVFDQAIYNRLNDPKTGARVLVQQRVHENDLAGHLLAAGGWDHLDLPMEYDSRPRRVTGIGWTDPRTEDGALLQPDRFDAEEIRTLKRRMGLRPYATQYQQLPAPAEGDIFKDAWWGWYRVDVALGSPDGPPLRYDAIECFVDSAQKTGEQNAYTVFAVYGRHGQTADLLEVVRKRLTFPQLIAEANELWDRWAPFGLSAFIVEDKASGIQFVQMCEDPPSGFRKLPALPVEPGPLDKVERANGVTGWASVRVLRLPMTAEGPLGGETGWVAVWRAEHRNFPNSTFTDQVDTTVMMFRRWFIVLERKPGGPALAAAGVGDRARFGAAPNGTPGEDGIRTGWARLGDL